MRTRKWLAVVAACGLTVFGLAVRPAEAEHGAGITDQWIVTLAPGVDPVAQAQLLATAVGGEVRHVYSHVLGGFSMTGTPLAADLLRANPAVSSVVADGPAHLAQTSGQVVPTGVERSAGRKAVTGGHTGAGVTVAVVDSGIDLVHPDLTPNLHPTLGANCSNPLLPPQDDNSHGTHVAGTIAAADNGFGVLGMAPAATLVPVKAFDAAGDSTWSIVICGLDYVAGNSASIDVVNMSFGDLSNEATACDGVTTSDIDALRQAVCDLTATGVIAVAAAGNNMRPVDGFVPAAFPEVITVSALSDFDGVGGGLGGCLLFGELCDDSFANLFSNFGPRVDLMAPGFEILSTMPGGLYATKDGTSMAAPHVSGAVAQVLAAQPTLDTNGVRAVLMKTGECPDGTAAGEDAACAGQGTWLKDPDTEPEPLLNTLRAVQYSPPPVDTPPTISIAAPASAASVAGTTVIAVAASDDNAAAGTLPVQARIDGGPWQTAAWNAGTARYEVSWDTRTASNGPHTIEATTTDSASQTATAGPVSVTVFNGMHVGDLDGAPVLGKRTWRAKATIAVHSPTEGIVDGATVSFTWSGAVGGSGTCTTRKGVCSATSGDISNAATSVLITVTGVSRSGQTYTAATNHDVDGGSNGTSLAVVR